MLQFGINISGCINYRIEDNGREIYVNYYNDFIIKFIDIGA